jgi:AAA+ ATPase superfamily predicted ATPase
MLKFYNREKEIVLLEKSEQKSLETAQMTFVTGRRRIGKTSLLTNVFSNKAVNLVKQLSGYHIEYRALSLNDM